MAIKKLAAQLIKLTPDTLADFSQAIPLPGERSVKARRTAQLRRLIQAGHFYGLDWARGRCRLDGRVYRLDGQHTTKLLNELLAHPDPAVPFPADLPITLVEWEFDSIEADAPTLFNTFNNPLSVRSNTDMMETYQAFYPELAGIDVALLMKAMNGVLYYEKQQHDRAKKKDPDARRLQFDARDMGVELHADRYRAFILWLVGFQELRLFKRTVTRSGLVASLYADWLENAETAQQFWTLVLSESAPDPDDETRSFAEQLKRMNADRKKVTQGEFFKEAAKAWKRYKRTLQRSDAAAA